MGTDIVYELRSLEVRTDVAYHGDEARLFNSTMRAAADQIERLRITPGEVAAIESAIAYIAPVTNYNSTVRDTLIGLLKRMTL